MSRGIGDTQRAALTLIADAGDAAIPLTRLKDMLGIDRAAVNRLIDSLADRGHVRVVRCGRYDLQKAVTLGAGDSVTWWPVGEWGLKDYRRYAQRRTSPRRDLAGKRRREPAS
jgi:biotin operon repressor